MTDLLKPESSSKGKWWGYAVILALGFLVYSFVTGNNPFAIFNFSAGGWLVASLLGAAVLLVGGEILIKKQTLTDFSAKTTRVAFAFGALVVAGIGISQIWSGGTPSFGLFTTIYNFVTTADPGVLVITTTIILLAAIILYGAAKDAWSGKGLIAIKTWRTAFAVLVVFACLFWLIGTSRMGQVGQAMQGAARTQLDAFLAGQPVNFAVNWGYVALGFFFLAFLWGLWKKEFIRTATAVVGAIIWLPFIAWLAWGSLPADYKADVSGAFGAANETLNPFLGETQQVQVALVDVGRDIPVFLGPYDNLTVSIPWGGFIACADATAGWKNIHGDKPWFDDYGFASFEGALTNKTLTLSPTLTEGMKEEGVTGIDLMVTVLKKGGTCPTF